MAIERIARANAEPQETTSTRRPSAPGRRGAARRRPTGAHRVLGRHASAVRTVGTLRLLSPTPCGGSCGARTSSASAARTSPVTSTLDGDIVERLSARCAMPRRSRAARRACGPPRGRRGGAHALHLARPAARHRRPRRPRCTAGGTRCGATPQAIGHHYDVGNDFYRLVLGPSMTYSCARFAERRAPTSRGTGRQARPGLPQARAARTARRSACSTSGADGARWPSTRPRNYDVAVVGITISRAAGRPWPASGSPRPASADRVEIRLQDYRELGGERFDAISSIGMSEHVGAARSAEYFAILRGVLAPGGRLLNHAISRSAARGSGGARSSAATCSPTAS